CIAELKGPQQHGVHRAEDRHVYSYAERKRQDGAGRKSGRALQRPHTVSEIRQKRVHTFVKSSFGANAKSCLCKTFWKSVSRPVSVCGIEGSGPDTILSYV